MKNLFLLWSLLPAVLSAQLTPMFQTTIYFEDAIGNRDSILVGYDTLANVRYNPDFGEVDLITPFDSVFEVRAAHWRPYNSDFITSKIIVGAAEEYLNLPDCYAAEIIIFYINAKYQPITILWDQTTFAESECIKNSFFYMDKGRELIDPFAWLAFTELRYACSSKTNQFQVSLGWQYKAKYELPYTMKRPIEGRGTDTLYGVGFTWEAGNFFSPCRLVSEEEPLQQDTGKTSVISPNPVKEMLGIRNLRLEPLVAVTVIDQCGRVVLHHNALFEQELTTLDVTSLANGLYFLRQRWKNGLEQTEKFVKMEY